MSRVSKSLKNAKVGVFFFILSIFVQFFSRKFFLENLGDSFIGLETTLRSILGFLNLTELGIGTAIGFTLYKPIFDKDFKEINKIIALLGVLYKRIGYIILGIGFIVSLFFSFIFKDTPFPLSLIYFVYYTLLCSTLLSYFVNYHISLFGADQKGYIVQKYFQSLIILRVVVQVLVVLYLKSFYIYISIELLFGIIYSILVRYKVKKVYPWLILNSEQKSEIIKEYPEIIKKIKQVFFHKLSLFMKNGTDNILIYALVNLQSVAFFGNYQLIFVKLGGLIKMAFAGTGSAVGNLIAERNQENIKKVFWELTTIQFFIAGLFSMILYHVMDYLIIFWLGEKYILSQPVLLLMVANFFMIEISTTIERFKNAYGLYADTYAAVLEAILNLVVSLIFGYIYGIAGIMLGTFVSMLIMVFFWKPYYVFRYGFKKSIMFYWKGTIPLIVVFIISLYSVNYLVSLFYYDRAKSSLFYLMLYTSKITFTVLFIYCILLYLFIPSFKAFLKRIKVLILNYFKIHKMKK